MELKKYKEAKELQEKIDELQCLLQGLSIVRDFTKTDMKIYFRKHGEKGTNAYFIPPYIANDICMLIRQNISIFESKLTEKFYNL